jgi:hypothetical protein
MTFEEARAELKRLADRREWALEYEVASYFEGPRIIGYIAANYIGEPRYGHAKSSPTYAGAIENVKSMLHPDRLSGEPQDEAPEDGEGLKVLPPDMENPFPAILNSIYPGRKE